MKFLIVDDDPFIVKMLDLTLHKTFPDIKIETSSDGEKALDMIFSGTFVPDIVLMDFMMPGIDGLETSKRIKEWSGERDLFIFILMITAKSQKETEMKSLKVADDFIQKPMDMDILVSRINAAMRITRLVHEKNELLYRNQQLYEHLLEINHINERLVNRLSEVIEQMAISLSEAIEYKDLTTGYHVLRVGYLSEAMARELDYDEERCEMLKYAGFFHDIGKIAIPDHILQKPGKLDEEEFEKIKKHSEIGAEIIRPIRFFKAIVEGIRYHHERWDGKGYPEGKKAEEIPLNARVISVADVFDVIVSPRPYKPAKTMDEAVEEIIRNKGTQFDPQVVDVFVKLYREEKVQEIYTNLQRSDQVLGSHLFHLMQHSK
jgi:putative two-component system response regulator